MGVRVPLRIRCGERSVTVSALLNSGFESSEPDLAAPVEVAEKLGLWPPREFELESVATAGGEVQLAYIRSKCVAELLGEEGEVLASSKANILVNPHLDEVLVSDYLIDELGIVVISFRRGLWRHKSDSPDKVRGKPREKLGEG